MKGAGVARIELEVREDDEEVVVVTMGLVEPATHAGPGLIVEGPAFQPLVVAAAVVLDDGDLAHVPSESGVGKGFESRPDLEKTLGDGVKLLLGLALETARTTSHQCGQNTQESREPGQLRPGERTSGAHGANGSSFGSSGEGGCDGIGTVTNRDLDGCRGTRGTLARLPASGASQGARHDGSASASHQHTLPAARGVGEGNDSSAATPNLTECASHTTRPRRMGQ